MIYAYLRVSTERQCTDNQRAEIINFAQSKGMRIDRWSAEKASGTRDRNCRSLGPLLKKMRKDDVLIVSEISRLSRTMLEIMTILGTCIKKEILLYSVKEGYAFENNMNSKIMAFAFGIASEIERNMISSRTKEALSLRKANGVQLGRPKGDSQKLQELCDKRGDILEALASGMSKTKIANNYNISRGTLYKLLKETE